MGKSSENFFGQDRIGNRKVVVAQRTWMSSCTTSPIATRVHRD